MSKAMMTRSKLVSGFTLIELIIVITISGIVAVLAATMLGNQMLAFVDLTRRADLVDQAETAVKQVTRDVRHALPNSLRVATNGADQYMEFIPIKDAGRYRARAGAGTGPEAINDDDNILDFSAADTQFQVLGRLPTVSNNDRLVIYNIGQVDGSGVPVRGANVYALAANNTASSAVPVVNSHVITDPGIAGYGGTDNNVLNLTNAHQFAFESPQQRFYVVDEAMSYICDMGSKTLWRYQDHAFGATQGTSLSTNPLLNATIKSKLIENISVCEFTYDSGNAVRSGLLTIRLTVEEDGERAQLIHQIHVDNSP